MGTVAVPVFLGSEPYGSLSLGAAKERFPDGPEDRLDACAGPPGCSSGV
jgi:hypothetical protein